MCEHNVDLCERMCVCVCVYQGVSIFLWRHAVTFRSPGVQGHKSAVWRGAGVEPPSGLCILSVHVCFVHKWPCTLCRREIFKNVTKHTHGFKAWVLWAWLHIIVCCNSDINHHLLQIQEVFLLRCGSTSCLVNTAAEPNSTRESQNQDFLDAQAHIHRINIRKNK